MGQSGPREPSAPDPAEAAIVDLLQQHLDEATTRELRQKALISEPRPPDHDLRPTDSLRPSDRSAPDIFGDGQPRKIL